MGGNRMSGSLDRHVGVVVVATVLMVIAACLTERVQGDILSYNVSSRRLYFRCPEEEYTEGSVEYIMLSAQDGIRHLANWRPVGKGEAVHGRITILPATPPYLLHAVLDHVTCYDAINYTCSMVVNPRNVDSPPATIQQSQQFVYQGDVSGPVLTVTPLRARYKDNDTVTLSCTAQIGTAANYIVWETRFPGETFQPVTDKRIHSSPEETDTCDVRVTSTMTQLLRADDDNRQWRCRLRVTNQEAVFVAAVECSDGTACSVPCKTLTTRTAETKKAAAQGQATDNMKDAVVDDSSDEAEVSETSPTLLILVAIIALLFSTMVISVVVMTVKVRSQHKKQLSPIYVTPPPSDCIAYRPWPVGTDQSRSLPEPPSEFFSHPSNFYELHRDDMNGNYRRGKGDDNDEEEDDETAPKLISPYGTTSRCSSSSVYISMSAVPSLHEWEGPEREGAGLVGEGAGRAGVTRIGRSESVYSNREAIEREAWKGSKNNSSSASHDSHVTLGNLKEWEAKTQS